MKLCPVCGNVLNVRGTCESCGWAETGTNAPHLLGLHFLFWIGLLIAVLGQLVYRGVCSGDEYLRTFGQLFVLWPLTALGGVFIVFGLAMSYFRRNND